jgi:hypothetical protein
MDSHATCGKAIYDQVLTWRQACNKYYPLDMLNRKRKEREALFLLSATTWCDATNTWRAGYATRPAVPAMLCAVAAYWGHVRQIRCGGTEYPLHNTGICSARPFVYCGIAHTICEVLSHACAGGAAVCGTLPGCCDAAK